MNIKKESLITTKTKLITVGRRKSAVARVYLSDGEGMIVVNNKKLEDYFNRDLYLHNINLPINLTNSMNTYNFNIKVTGGGITGQSDAIKLGITRALIELDPEVKPLLKEHKLTTRDPRAVERKKYGRKKARKKFQFSKR